MKLVSAGTFEEIIEILFEVSDHYGAENGSNICLD